MKTIENSIGVSAQTENATTQTDKQVEVNHKPQTQLEGETTIQTISIDKLMTPDYHPRSDMGDIDSLADSIKRDGTITPPTVMYDAESDIYLPLYGVRRIAAHRKIGSASISCIVKQKVGDSEAARLAYFENMERKNLNAVEQALHIQKMKNVFGFSNNELQVKGYGTPAVISNKLKILGLPDSVQKSIVEGKLTEAHGRKLLKLKTAGEQERMAKQAIESDLSATVLEKKVARYIERDSKPKAKKVLTPNALDPDLEGIYFKDSRNMSETPDKTVHLIVGSPPYGLGFEFEEGYSFETMFEETKEVLAESARVLVPGGIIAINFTDIQDFQKKKGNTEHKEWLFVGPHIQNALRKHNIILTDVIQWVKQTPWSNKLHLSFNIDTDPHTSYRHIKKTEQIFIFRKNGERAVPEKEIAQRSRLSKEQWREWCPNVWNINSVPGQNQKGHPCVYPEVLCDRLIKMYSYEGDTVLDPWLGSGTTVKVARELNRIGVGYERERNYKPVIMEKLGLQPIAKPNVKEATIMMAFAEEQLKDTYTDETPIKSVESQAVENDSTQTVLGLDDSRDALEMNEEPSLAGPTPQLQQQAGVIAGSATA